ncbi:hypothetical protein [Propionivibrio sp.]|jgi:chromosome segregation ATPase|uniref:hypothetical protein n=1 Tax=Propionivibrio sp. TaxID=2212460 RepID=UPI003BF2B870
MRRVFRKVTVLGAICALSGGAWSQAALPAPPKAASKSMMTRDELRRCMKLPDTIKAMAAAVEQSKGVLDQDRLKIDPAKAELATLRTEVEAQKAVVQKSDGAVRELSKEIDQWNTELEDLEKNDSKTAQRRLKEIKGQQSGLMARNKDAVSQRDKAFGAYEAAVAKFNARGKELETSINEWNARNQRLVEEAEKVTELRDDYAADCSNRRFREEDEIAIKQGK